MLENKRIFPRFSFSEPVQYGLPESSVNGSVAGNISLGGISLKVQEFVPVGVVLELQVCLGQSLKYVNLRARVVRVREVSADGCYEIGLRFIEDVQSMRTISEYISAR